MKEYTMQQQSKVTVTSVEADTEADSGSKDITQLITQIKDINTVNNSWLDNVIKTIKSSNISKYAQGYIKRVIDEDMTIFLDHEREDFKREIIKYVSKYGMKD